MTFKMELKNKKIAFLGDSITEGVGASAGKNRYVDVFSELSKCKPVNLGVSGTRIAKQIKPTVESPSFDEYFALRIEKIPQDTDIIVVFGGVNDFLHGDAPFGAFGDTDINSFCGAVYNLFVTLYTRFPDALIVDITPLHNIYELSSVRGNGTVREHLFIDYVKIIKKTCAFLSVPILDLYSASNMQPLVETLNKKYFADGLHPNDLGHKNIAERLFSFLLSNIVSFLASSNNSLPLLLILLSLLIALSISLISNPILLHRV